MPPTARPIPFERTGTGQLDRNQLDRRRFGQLDRRQLDRTNSTGTNSTETMKTKQQIYDVTCPQSQLFSPAGVCVCTALHTVLQCTQTPLMRLAPNRNCFRTHECVCTGLYTVLQSAGNPNQPSNQATNKPHTQNISTTKQIQFQQQHNNISTTQNIIC